MLIQFLKKLVGIILVLTGLYIGLLALNYEACRQNRLLQLGVLMLAFGIGGPGATLFNSKRRLPAEKEKSCGN